MSDFEVINIGALPNDGEGDPLRVAFQKINNNFTIQTQIGQFTADAYTTGDTAGQVIFQTAANLFTQGTFQINSINSATDDSQNILLKASISNDGANVSWVGYGATFINDPVTGYNVDISGGNVRILSNPIPDEDLYHFITGQVTFAVDAPGLLMQVDSETPLQISSN